MQTITDKSLEANYSEVQTNSVQLQVPPDLLNQLRTQHADVEQFKKIANLELQIKELQFKNTILEIYVKMGLKQTDSFDINTGIAEIK